MNTRIGSDTPDLVSSALLSSQQAGIPEPSWGTVVWAMAVVPGADILDTQLQVSPLKVVDPLHRSGVVTDSLSYLLSSSWIVLTVSFTEPKPLPINSTSNHNN